jgi:hypothetical protein
MNDIRTAVLAGIVCLAVFGYMAGCTSNSAPSNSDLKSSNLTYFKDSRTGICYSAMSSLDVHSGWKSTTITYVPCTDAVESAIKQDASK